jgi:hypothetical protein
LPRFTVHSLTTHGALGLAFEIRGNQLVCTGESLDLPEIILQAYDPAHDIAYRSPAPLTPAELEEESHIHIPPLLRNQIDRRVLVSTLGTQVLMQYTEKMCAAISPLAALRAVLDAVEGVNAAIVEANNGAFATLHRAANAVDATLSNTNPEILAEITIFSGSDQIELPSMARWISIQDFSLLCQFTEDGLAIVAEAPQYYTLAIGAARVYFEMIRS